jgi:type IV secretory pathway TrbD component
MSDLERSPSRVPRKTREERAYRLVMASGTLGVVAVVGVILAIAGVIGLGLPLIAAALAAVCFLLFRRAVSR